MKKIYSCVALLLVMLGVQLNANDELLIGHVGDDSGVMQWYYKTIRDGMYAYFHMINQQGGIHGKQIKLISVSAGNVQGRMALFHKLRKQGVSLFMGMMNNDTFHQVLPFAQKGSIALLFPWVGSDGVRQSSMTGVVHGVGLIRDQLHALAEYAVMSLGHKRVAIFHGDDAFSTDAAQQLKDELATYRIKPLDIVVYNRATLSLHKKAHNLISVDPKVVFCLGTHTPVVSLINYFFEQGHYNTHFLGIDSTCMVKDIMSNKRPLFAYSSPLPHFLHAHTPLADGYEHDITAFIPSETPNILSYTYYVNAAILVDVLKNIAGTITPQAVVGALEGMTNRLVGGIHCNFDKKTRHVLGETISIVQE